MCTGVEWVYAAMAAGSAVQAYSALTTKVPKLPDIIRENPLADQSADETKAAQEAEAQSIALRRSARKNSLLSMAGGGAGDLAPASLAAGKASGKTNLGD